MTNTNSGVKRKCVGVVSKKNMITSVKKHLHKLKGEVGMAEPKSTQTRVYSRDNHIQRCRKRF